VQGYSRCQQTETTCRFYRNSKPDEISCYEICGTEGDCTQWEEGDPNLCDVGSDGSSCDEPLGDGVCECERKQPNGGTGGSGGGNGARTLEDRCAQSDKFYCGNGHACQEEGWNLDPLIFDDLYGESVADCKSQSRPCTTEEAYCEDRSFEGTYNAVNHEACISGQDPEVWSCTLDEFGFPVFPPECDQICATSPD